MKVHQKEKHQHDSKNSDPRQDMIGQQRQESGQGKRAETLTPGKGKKRSKSKKKQRSDERDEIQRCRDDRQWGAYESVWKCAGYTACFLRPNVVRLVVHIENEEWVVASTVGMSTAEAAR